MSPVPDPRLTPMPAHIRANPAPVGMVDGRPIYAKVAEVTPAVQRAVDAVLSKPRIGNTQDIVETALAAALDVEEMARVLYREGAWCGVCEYDGWDACKECRETVTGYATTLRAAILGGAS